MRARLLVLVVWTACNAPPPSRSEGTAVASGPSASGSTPRSAPPPVRSAASTAPAASSAVTPLPSATSGDGAMRAYVDDSDGLSIWTATAEGAHAHRELSLAAHPGLASATSAFDLAFSADRKRVHFRSVSDANTTPLWTIALGRGRVARLAHHADAYHVIRSCRHAPWIDHLAVRESHLRLGAIHLETDWFWLKTPDGKQVGPIGTEENLARLLARRCGVGVEPPPAPAAPRPPELRALPLKCGDVTIFEHATPLLDGTQARHLAVADDAVPAAQRVPLGTTIEQAQRIVRQRCPR